MPRFFLARLNPQIGAISEAPTIAAARMVSYFRLMSAPRDS